MAPKKPTTTTTTTTKSAAQARKKFSTKAPAPPQLPEDRKEPEVLLGSSGGGASPAGWHATEAMLRCPKEYQLKHVRHIYAPKHQTPDHFAVGGLFHAARARWFADRFATGADAWARIVQAVEKEAAINKLPVSLQAEQKTLVLMEHYISHWSMRPKPRPLACEYPVGPSPLQKGDAAELWRTARLDDVSIYPEAGNRLCIGEAKTTSTSIGDTESQYDLHGQPLLQLALWATSENGEKMHGPVAGYVLDVVVKGYGDKKPQFARIFKPVPAFALQWYITSMQFYAGAASRVTWDSEVPRNAGMCTRLAGRGRVPCEYRELCKFGRAATGGYVMGEGKSLLSHKPEPGKMKHPWE